MRTCNKWSKNICDFNLRQGEVTHNATSVARVKDPSNALCESIAGVDGTLDLAEKKMSSLFPILDGKVLDIYVAGAFGRKVSVHHFDGGLIVFEQWNGLGLIEAKLTKDGTEVFGDLSGRYSGQEFCFCAASSCDGLGLATRGYNATGKHETITSGGALVPKIVAMGSIGVSNELEWISGQREVR
jgi:hypothetical protein